jgi:hypothetical protein
MTLKTRAVIEAFQRLGVAAPANGRLSVEQANFLIGAIREAGFKLVPVDAKVNYT